MGSKTIEIALVAGDGSAPEMMRVACSVVAQAALLDGVTILFVPTPMGWNAYDKFGDTLPKMMLDYATRLGILFFGGVGDPEMDNTIGAKFPVMRPEARCLLTIRKKWGLLLNFRPMIYYKELDHLAMVKPEVIPVEGIEQHFIRCLLEDVYFGTGDIMKQASEIDFGSLAGHKTVIDITPQLRTLGVKEKTEVSGNEKQVVEFAYYRRTTIQKYFRCAFQYAKDKGLPLISIDKANVMARYKFWRDIATEIGREEFPDVELRHQLVDSANALLFTPAELHGVIACGNEHGDILSDGAAAALGSMGMMCSSAINPDNGMAMFESGAGTAPTLRGKDKANPIGRILTGAMMLRHIGAVKGANAIEVAVKKVLLDGWRTGDIAGKDDSQDKILGTEAMGSKIMAYL